MTAIEKATELIERFSPHTDCAGDEATSYECQKIKLNHAKKVSVICVDEILKQLEEMRDEEFITFWHGKNAGDTIDGTNLKIYWNEVKQAIEQYI